MRYSYWGDRNVLLAMLGREITQPYELEAVIHWYFLGLSPIQIAHRIWECEGK